MDLKRSLGGLLVVACMSAAVPSYACDPSTERCKKVMSLMDQLGYQEKLMQIQMLCRGKAASMRPEVVKKERPALLMGIQESSTSWAQLGRAYEMFVDEACGGDEVVGLLLGGYRHAWDTQLEGVQLDAAMLKVKTEGIGAIEAEVQMVRTRVNQVIRPLLTAMGKYAESRYEARIKGIVTGEALEISESNMCKDGLSNELMPLSEQVLGKQKS